MSRKKRIRVAALLLGSGALWVAGTSSSGSLAAVFDYALMGILAGVALTWIFRSFASLPNNRFSVSAGAIAGAFIFTPLIALLFGRTEPTESSAVVLALVAGAIAALAGAVRGVAALAHDAFGEWRADRVSHGPQLNLGGAHR